MGEQAVVVAALGVAIAAGAPVLLCGPPGTGKGSTVRAMGEQAGGSLELIREGVDLSASRIDALVADGGCVVVTGTARGAPSASLANRFCHLDWSIEARAVSDGFVSGWPVPALPKLGDTWLGRVPVMRSRVAAFLFVRPDLAIAVPDDAADAGGAWPSPRSWEMAARLLAAGEAAEVDEAVTTALVQGCVGADAGADFLTWLVDAQLRDPEEALGDPDGFALPERADLAYAELSSVAAAVAAFPSRDRWQRAWRIFAGAASAPPDVVAPAARVLLRCRPAGTPLPQDIELFMPLLDATDLLR